MTNHSTLIGLDRWEQYRPVSKLTLEQFFEAIHLVKMSFPNATLRTMFELEMVIGCFSTCKMVGVFELAAGSARACLVYLEFSLVADVFREWGMNEGKQPKIFRFPGRFVCRMHEYLRSRRCEREDEGGFTFYELSSREAIIVCLGFVVMETLRERNRHWRLVRLHYVRNAPTAGASWMSVPESHRTSPSTTQFGLPERVGRPRRAPFSLFHLLASSAPDPDRESQSDRLFVSIRRYKPVPASDVSGDVTSIHGPTPLKWLSDVQAKGYQDVTPQRHSLICISPHGGQGKASQLWRETIEHAVRCIIHVQYTGPASSPTNAVEIARNVYSYRIRCPGPLSMVMRPEKVMRHSMLSKSPSLQLGDFPEHLTSQDIRDACDCSGRSSYTFTRAQDPASMALVQASTKTPFRVSSWVVIAAKCGAPGTKTQASRALYSSRRAAQDSVGRMPCLRPVMVIFPNCSALTKRSTVGVYGRVFGQTGGGFTDIVWRRDCATSHSIDVPLFPQPEVPRLFFSAVSEIDESAWTALGLEYRSLDHALVYQTARLRRFCSSASNLKESVHIPFPRYNVNGIAVLSTHDAPGN
ncbi:hypothetical protein B0H16DRAFT_1465190 [Mycena metata]|uniref:Uncharacterized protein n=1 Tax=Mycena metata TaxID=1033252 RepID=A0AAD7MZU8_9AGAR|nr:hypothetical protein B0H16DRAFT_1465190 [Mycena metata]